MAGVVFWDPYGGECSHCNYVARKFNENKDYTCYVTVEEGGGEGILWQGGAGRKL